MKRNPEREAKATQALNGRFEEARLEVATVLEPKVQRVEPPRRTLKYEADLAEWLAEAGVSGESPPKPPLKETLY